MTAHHDSHQAHHSDHDSEHNHHSGYHSTEIRQRSKFRLPALLVIAVGLVIFGYLVTRIFAAGSAQLYLTPASGTYTVGSQVSVQVWVNTGSDPANAVEADISYPAAHLQFVTVDSTGSAFSIDAQHSGGNGTVNIARGVVGNVTGAGLVATVKFTVLAAGSAPLTFLNSSAIIRSTDNTNILNTKTGATYTLNTPVNPTPTPVPTHTPTPAPGKTATPTPVSAAGTTPTPSSIASAGSPTPGYSPGASTTPEASVTPTNTPIAAMTTSKAMSPTLILGIGAVAIPLLLLLVVGGLLMNRHKTPTVDSVPDGPSNATTDQSPVNPPSQAPGTFMPNASGSSSETDESTDAPVEKPSGEPATAESETTSSEPEAPADNSASQPSDSDSDNSA